VAVGATAIGVSALTAFAGTSRVTPARVTLAPEEPTTWTPPSLPTPLGDEQAPMSNNEHPVAQRIERNLMRVPVVSSASRLELQR
jgi:hypothetical protein